jgi:hypothetical protein
MASCQDAKQEKRVGAAMISGIISPVNDLLWSGNEQAEAIEGGNAVAGGQ